MHCSYSQSVETCLYALQLLSVGRDVFVCAAVSYSQSVETCLYALQLLSVGEDVFVCTAVTLSR